MLFREGTFAATGGLPLHFRAWSPEGAPVALLAASHGLGDHSGLYRVLGEALAPLGIGVRVIDHRGHGLSPGRRGHIDHWEELRGDFLLFRRLVAAEADVPLFILGNSLGGLIVLDSVLAEPAGVTGAIALSPFLVTAGVSPFLLKLAKVVSNVWPTFTLDNRLDLDNLCRDAARRKAFVGDPLFHTRSSARLGAEIPRALADVQSHAAAFATPLLLMHGTADRIARIEGSEAFNARVTGADRTFRRFEGGFHNLLHDDDRETVFREIGAWILARSLSSPRTRE